MAKLVFFAVLVAAIAAVSVAEGEAAENYNPLGSMQCQRELQESSLDACRQVVDRQLAGQMPFFYPRSLRWSTGMRMRCCQQLQDVSRECRCAAVRRMVRDYEQQTMAPPEEEYHPEQQQQEQGYYGETAEQEEQEYYYGSPSRQRGYGFPPRFGTEQQPQTTRVRLTRARQYAAQLPATCRLEPQECSVFYSGQYQY